MRCFLYVLSVVFCVAFNQGTSYSKEQGAASNNENGANGAFDINKIPVAATFNGDFPYLSAPESYQYSSKKTKEFEEKYFFYNDSLVHKVEGKYYHARIFPKENVEFSNTYIVNNYKKAIEKAGGVEIYSGWLPNKAGALISKEQPSYTEDIYDIYPYKYKQFIIRTPKENIWIELIHGLNANMVDFTVVSEKVLEETVSVIKADEIQKQLNEKGKAILYIHFDTDKATLTEEGQQLVEEIENMLNKNKELKLSIEGHTDNTGSAAYNKTLSQKRAEAVLGELVSAGIASSRLQAKGFGAENPLVANDTEENKAKNRRVELVKVQ